MADDFDPYYQWLAIPPKHQPPNHYRLLGVEEFESNVDVIENAADQRMQHVRSFQNGPHGELSQRLLNEITAAKLCLLNVGKKAEYDRKLRVEKDAAEPRRLKPLPRLEPTPAAAEGYRVAADVPAIAPAVHRPRRRLSPHQAAMMGAGLGLLVVAVSAYVVLSRIDWTGERTPIANKPNDSQPAETANEKKTRPADAGQKVVAASPKVDPGGSLPVGEWCDVLPWIDIAQDAVSGQWQRTADEVEAAQSEKGKVLTLPLTLEGEYRLMAEFTCHTPGSVEILIPVADRSCNVELGAFSGLFWVDGRHTPDNGTGTKRHPVVLGQRHRAEIEVTHAADKSSIRVAVDGEPIMQWQGNPASLSGWGTPKRPAIGAWDAEIRFHRVQVRLVSGKAARLARASTSSKPSPPRAGGRPAEMTGEHVFLDDSREEEFKVGFGTLGRQGQRGFDPPEAVYQGKKMPHALAVHAASQVIYRLNSEFATFRATAALLDYPDRAMAESALTFRALGDGKLLWQSSPLQRLGTGQPLVVSVDGVQTLTLEVHCPGRNGHAHAAWLMPMVSRPARAGQPELGITSLANPTVCYHVPEQHYALIRGGEVEAVVVDNEPVDNDVLPGHRLGYHGVASLTHKARGANVFVPSYGGLHLASIYDGTNRPVEATFEPRRTPMELRVVSDRIVELYQKPTPTWGLESAIRYHLLDDGVIEMTFECIPRQKTFAKGYIGLYFASHIHQAESPDIYFVGRTSGAATTDWVRAVSPTHAELATHLAVSDQREFPRDADFPLPAAVNYSKHRYDEPWFYGGSHGMAFVQMFRREDQVRFTQSPIGGDPKNPGSPEWSFNWLIPNYEVGKLYRLVMRAMYAPLDALHVGLVESHLRRLNGGAALPAPSTPKAVFLDDLTEVEFKVGVGTLGKRGERGYTGHGVPDGRVLFQGCNYTHALSTHPASGQVAYVVYQLDGKFASFGAVASLMDIVPGTAVRSPATFRVLGDGKLLWTSARIDRAGAGQLAAVDIRGVQTLRLECLSSGDNGLQCAAWLNPLVSTIAEPPLPAFSREAVWAVEGAEFKISETEKGALLELVPGSSKLYSKIQIALARGGQMWSGTGELYFRSSPGRRYEAKIEIPSEDLFSNKTLRVRTICPDAAMRTKLADTTSTWKKKE